LQSLAKSLSIIAQPLIGIDASRYPGELRTGTETYSRELIDAIADIPDLPFSVRCYVNQADDESVQRLARLGDVKSIPFPRFWTHARLSLEVIRHRPNLLFIPSHVIPAVHPRSVVTIHDLGYLHEPDAHPLRQRRMLDLTTRWNARRAAHIIAISETTRADLMRFYGTAEEKITVVYHGVNDQFNPATDNDQRRIRALYDLPEHFVLALGTIQPRKNLVRLAQAVATLQDQIPDLTLVLAGKRGWMADSVIADIRKELPDSRFRELGYVPAADLSALYSAASVTAMVSTYEGFGLPVLEAFRCGAPLVISDTPTLIEVAGDAALIARTTSVPDLASQLAVAIADAGIREQMRARGLRRAASFSWSAAARKTVEVLDRVSRDRMP
jgi:glycosyltransferase involved in cell wall biosynthesis